VIDVSLLIGPYLVTGQVVHRNREGCGDTCALVGKVNRCSERVRASVEAINRQLGRNDIDRVRTGVRRIARIGVGRGERAYSQSEYRIGDERVVVVSANVRGRDLVGFVDEAKANVAQHLKLPSGYNVQWGGQFENQQRAAKRLSMVIPVAIGLIFLLLFSTFASVRQAILVLSNIPFAMIGGVFSLWLSGEYLSVPASVGFIALLGIAVLNGVVMVTYFNQLRALGLSLAEVVVEGAKRRLRPVMMTASIAAFGLVPLLFATGPGSEIQRPLAIVVIGGLVTSTLLTLVLLPILYRRFGIEK